MSVALRIYGNINHVNFFQLTRFATTTKRPSVV